MENAMVSPDKMLLNNEQLIAHLNTLIETCKDGQNGYTTAAEDVKNPAYKTLFSRYAQQRGTFIGILQVEVRHLGGDPEQSGSMIGSLHRGWINLKSALTTGDEAAILAECVRGEDAAIEAYKTVTAEILPFHINSMIEQQYADIRDARDKVRALDNILTV